MRNILSIRLSAVLCFALGGAALVFASSLLMAHEDATGIYKERMDLMEINKEAAGLLFEMVSGQADFDAEVVKARAQAVAAGGGETLTSLFPVGSLDEPTEALPAIWENWEEFSGYADQLVTRAQALEAAADEGTDAVEAAFTELGDTCNSCHTKFRVPQD